MNAVACTLTQIVSRCQFDSDGIMVMGTIMVLGILIIGGCFTYAMTDMILAHFRKKDKSINE